MDLKRRLMDLKRSHMNLKRSHMDLEIPLIIKYLSYGPQRPLKDLIRSYMDLKRPLMRSHCEKRPGQFFLKEAILIPFMVRIIQANFKKWPTIVII